MGFDALGWGGGQDGGGAGWALSLAPPQQLDYDIFLSVN